MKWLLFAASLALLAVALARSEPRPPPQQRLNPVHERISHASKTQSKRGVVGVVPTYSHGHDIPVVRHSLLKPFVVKYPMRVVPVGVKIPLKMPPLQHAAMHHHQHHHVAHQAPAAQRPTNLHPNAVLPATPCPMLPQPAKTPAVVAPAVPFLPAGTVHFVPAPIPTPALTPLLPLPLPPTPFVTKPLVPVAASPVPVAPVPAVIKPGHSLHTSLFATYPRHPIIPGGPVLPLHHVAPLAPPLHHVNFAPPVHHVNFAPPVHHVNFAPFPLHVNKIPLNFHQAPQIPLNGVFQHPLQVGQVPFNIQGGFAPSQPPATTGFATTGFATEQAAFPTDVPLGAGEIPASHGQGGFFFEPQQPNGGGVEFASPGVIQDQGGVGVIHQDQGGIGVIQQDQGGVGVIQQDQGNENNFVHSLGGGGVVQDDGGANVWTPMTTTSAGALPQFPTDQQHHHQFVPAEPQQPTFGPGHDGTMTTIHHQGTDQQNHQGYHYQAPNVPFNEGHQHQQHQQQQFHHSQSLNDAFQSHFPRSQHLPLRRPFESFAGYHN